MECTHLYIIENNRQEFAVYLFVLFVEPIKTLVKGGLKTVQSLNLYHPNPSTFNHFWSLVENMGGLEVRTCPVLKEFFKSTYSLHAHDYIDHWYWFECDEWLRATWLWIQQGCRFLHLGQIHSFSLESRSSLN